MVVPAEVLQAVRVTVTKEYVPAAGPSEDAAPAAEKWTIPREPKTLDIARFANVPDAQRFILDAYRGGHVIDGLPFCVEEEIRMWGESVPKSRPGCPMTQSVSGIEVGRTFDELHLIHDTIWNDVAGEVIAYVLLNYEDGTKSVLPIRYGVHVIGWWYLPSYDQQSPTDPDTKVCWWRPPVSYKAPIRLFKSKLMNPVPDKVVESIDVVSARSLTMYCLIAATVADRDPDRPISPPAAALERERKFDGKLVIRVLDTATGKPVEGARVNSSMHVRDEGVVGPVFRTSTDGEGTLQYPVEQTSRIWIQVKKEGYLRDSGTWVRDIPESTTFQLRSTNSARP